MNLSHKNKTDITFSMENGLIILVKKTYKSENIFINGSFLEKELEFNSQGKIMKLGSFKKPAVIKSN